MSITVIEDLFRIRDLLKNPNPQKPSFHQMLRQTFSDLRDITNELNNSGRPWGESEYQLNYVPSQSEYEINVSDFGKCMFVTRVCNNPWIHEVPVRIGDRNNEHYGTIFQLFYGMWGAILPWGESPEQLTFYRSGTFNAAQMVSVMPQPQTAQTYIIRYMPGVLSSNGSLQDSVQLPEHCELRRLRSAMALLNYTEWGDDKAVNRQERIDLSEGFKYQLDRKEPIFSRYIQSINIPRICSIDDWNN